MSLEPPSQWFPEVFAMERISVFRVPILDKVLHALAVGEISTGAIYGHNIEASGSIKIFMLVDHNVVNSANDFGLLVRMVLGKHSP